MNLYSRLVDVLVKKRHSAYDSGKKASFQVSTPIFSTGSLTIGGAGKTPLTHFMTRLFYNEGYKPAILSRGYGRKSKGIQEVILSEDLSKSSLHYGDEPVMLKSLLPDIPLVVSENRYQGACYLEKYHQPTMIILDDGFQHRNLVSDKNIVIFKKEFKGPNAKYFPFGDLRDSLSRLKDASLIFLEESAAPKVYAYLQGFAPVIPYHLTFTLSPPLENHKSVCAFCGIANPHRFFETLVTMGITPQKKVAFRDHVTYTPRKMHFLEKQKSTHYVTTHKDYVKLPPAFLKSHRISVVHMELTIPEPLTTEILKILAA